jgi:hypothetical protein
MVRLFAHVVCSSRLLTSSLLFGCPAKVELRGNGEIQSVNEDTRSNSQRQSNIRNFSSNLWSTSTSAQGAFKATNSSDDFQSPSSPRRTGVKRRFQDFGQENNQSQPLLTPRQLPDETIKFFQRRSPPLPNEVPRAMEPELQQPATRYTTRKAPQQRTLMKTGVGSSPKTAHTSGASLIEQCPSGLHSLDFDGTSQSGVTPTTYHGRPSQDHPGSMAQRQFFPNGPVPTRQQVGPSMFCQSSMQGMPHYYQPITRASMDQATTRVLESEFPPYGGFASSQRNVRASRRVSQGSSGTGPSLSPYGSESTTISVRSMGSTRGNSRSWWQEKRNQTKSQERAFTKKKENPFANYKHDPNDAEGFLDNLNTTNNERQESTIIPQKALNALRRESTQQRLPGMVPKKFEPEGRRSLRGSIFASQNVNERSLLAMKAAEAETTVAPWSSIYPGRQVSPIPRAPFTNHAEHSITPGNLSIVTTDYDQRFFDQMPAPMGAQYYDQSDLWQKEQHVTDFGKICPLGQDQWNPNNQWGAYHDNQVLEYSTQPGMEAFSEYQESFADPAFRAPPPQYQDATIGHSMYFRQPTESRPISMGQIDLLHSSTSFPAVTMMPAPIQHNIHRQSNARYSSVPPEGSDDFEEAFM